MRDTSKKFILIPFQKKKYINFWATLILRPLSLYRNLILYEEMAMDWAYIRIAQFFNWHQIP